MGLERSNISRTFVDELTVGSPSDVKGDRSIAFHNGGQTSRLTAKDTGSIQINSGVDGVAIFLITEPTEGMGIRFVGRSNAQTSYMQSMSGGDFAFVTGSGNMAFVVDETRNHVRMGGDPAGDGSDLASLCFGGVDKGFLPPRLTTVERVALSATTDGLTVYDTDLKRTMQSDGLTWKEI